MSGRIGIGVFVGGSPGVLRDPLCGESVELLEVNVYTMLELGDDFGLYEKGLGIGKV